MSDKRKPGKPESLSLKAGLCPFFKDCLLLLKDIKGDETGDYLKFGVFNGNSIGSMLLARVAVGPRSMRLFGFDAFEGLPAVSEHEDGGVWKTGFYACSFEIMQQCLVRRNIDPDCISWVRGWDEDTLNDEVIRKLNLCNIALAFIDCDTYSSSKTVLDFIGPFVTGPMIICLDDWKLNDLDVKGLGEYKSFNEFSDCNPHLGACPSSCWSFGGESDSDFVHEQAFPALEDRSGSAFAAERAGLCA